MIRKETTPQIYRSDLIASIKKKRTETDARKKDFRPEILNFDNLKIFLARHFGFCFGVENAIEIAYKAVDEYFETHSDNNERRLYLLSEMIHNPDVNNDLLSRGVKFLCDTKGNSLIPFSELNKGDTVILPAFGVSREIEAELTSRGVDLTKYDTTCPFVKRVWKKAWQIAEKGYTVVIHGKPEHEETRATFSHVANQAATIVIRDTKEAEELAHYIKKETLTYTEEENFYSAFSDRISKGFSPKIHLRKLGVVNQTTMLAEDTLAVTDILKGKILTELNPSQLSDVFADMRDTLCYATSENQSSVWALLEQELDLVIVVGGFNSSNTMHLAKLASKQFKSYHINAASAFTAQEITYRDCFSGEIKKDFAWLKIPQSSSELRVGLTAGASTPDSVVESVINKLVNSVNLLVSI
jgi:4-hydroxy-3-methylbut-2-en-1-yl diphosphate reductase